MKITKEIPFVRVGDPPRAADHNRLIQQVRDNSHQVNQTVNAPNQNRTVLMTKNVSGEDFEVGEPVVWSSTLSVASTSDFNPRESFAEYVCESDRPTWHSDVISLGCVLDDTPNGEFGRVVIGGLAILKLSSGSGDWASPDPADDTQWKLSTSSGMVRVINKINADYAIAQIGVDQPRWRYRLNADSAAPSLTSAKLLSLDGTEFASSVDLSDPFSISSGQETDDEGFCVYASGKFYAETPKPSRVQMVTDVIVGLNDLTIQRKNVSVFGAEDITDEVIAGTECL